MESLAAAVLLLQSLPSRSPKQSPAVLDLQLDLLPPNPLEQCRWAQHQLGPKPWQGGPLPSLGHEPCSTCPPEAGPVCTRGTWESLCHLA